MKLPVLSLVAGLATAPLVAAEAGTDLSDPKEKTSYALGVNFGANLKSNGIEVNLDSVRRGIEDALAGNPKLSDQEMRETFRQIQVAMQARREQQAGANKEVGEKFLAENASKAGVQKTASGLQYRIIEEGSGESPTSNDQVSVKYTGRLIDGTVFDSTDRRQGQPARFQVSGVIPGWGEALQKMKKGAKWELFIPSDLAYRERGSPPNIPGNSTLIFDVELVDIHAATPPPRPREPVTSNIIKVPSAADLEKGAQVEFIKPEDVEKEIAKERARQEAEKQKQQ